MPHRSAVVPSPADLAACRALLRGGSRSFHAASLLLPRAVADSATSLYAFCRVADDAIDTGRDKERSLTELRERLRLAYAGTPAPVPADRALAHVMANHAIPLALPDAMLEGFAWDAAGRRYETLADLLAYATRVAGTVGAMMALIMGARAPAAVARATDLGIAMQLSNIARDVGEDARAGRLYLPLAWLREAGIDADAWLAAPSPSPALANVVRRLLDEASTFYSRAGDGIATLPASCRPGIRAARALYAEIGHAVARRGYDSVSGRAVVPAARKLAVVARAAWSRQAGEAGQAPAAEAARFLVAAVAAAPWTAAHPPGRLAWTLDLFARLERRAPSLGSA